MALGFLRKAESHIALFQKKRLVRRPTRFARGQLTSRVVDFVANLRCGPLPK